MSPLMIAICGYIMLIALVYLIMKGKFTPAIVFVTLSLILAIVVGYDIGTISTYIKSGINSVLSTCVMFGFAVLFFTTLTEAGLFTPIIDFLKRTLGKSAIGVGIGAILVTAVGQLGGAATAAALICIPFFLPLFKQHGMQGKHLMLVFGLTSGIMNLLPWNGPMLRHSAVTGIEATELWRVLLPGQIFGIVLTMAIAVYFGIRFRTVVGEGGTVASLTSNAKVEAEAAAEAAEERKPLTWKWYFNLILLVVTIYLLVRGKITSYIVMAAATNIAMIVNFIGQKPEEAIIKKTSGVGYYNLILLFSTGIFVGIISQGDQSIVYHMATTLLNILPAGLVKHLHLIMGVLSTPLGFAFPSSAYDTSIVPLCIEMGTRYNIPVQAMSACMAIGKNIFNIGAPTYPSTFFILGLCEVELKDYIKFGFLPMWGVGILMILFLVVVGAVPF